MSSIPEGFNTITPYLVLKDAAAGIEHYCKAFGAQEQMRMPSPGGGIMHACLDLGTSKLFLCDEIPEQGMTGSSGSRFYLYFEDVDARHAQALTAGMQEITPPTDMFWGDRMSMVADSFGHVWSLASHVRDVSPEEMAEAMKQSCT